VFGWVMATADAVKVPIAEAVPAAKTLNARAMVVNVELIRISFLQYWDHSTDPKKLFGLNANVETNRIRL
jgi:hypothetical protein